MEIRQCDGLTWVGAREACASKNAVQQKCWNHKQRRRYSGNTRDTLQNAQRMPQILLQYTHTMTMMMSYKIPLENNDDDYNDDDDDNDDANPFP